jgi:hypothetical protein
LVALPKGGTQFKENCLSGNSLRSIGDGTGAEIPNGMIDAGMDH